MIEEIAHNERLESMEKVGCKTVARQKLLDRLEVVKKKSMYCYYVRMFVTVIGDCIDDGMDSLENWS